MQEPSLLELLKNGVHFGHQTSRWYPKMKPFIFTSRNGIHILNLEKTLEQVQKAQVFLADIAEKRGNIIFVGTKRQAKEIVRKAAESCGANFIVERWLGGLLTNYPTVSKAIQRLRTLTADRDAGRLEKYVKKERLKFDEEIEKLEKIVGGLRSLTKLPDALFVVDVKHEKTAIREAVKVGIPVVAMVDTNTDPSLITIPIPANDDATKSITLITEYLAAAIREGAARAPAVPEKPVAVAEEPTAAEKPVLAELLDDGAKPPQTHIVTEADVAAAQPAPTE